MQTTPTTNLLLPSVIFDDPNQIPAAQRYGLAWNVSKKQDSDNILWYDLNADGIVNDSDLTILVDNVLTSVKSPESLSARRYKC